MYQYPSLPNTNSIRLLRLKPAIATSPVHCILSAHEIEHAPAFEALSYTWGQRVVHRIQCDDAGSNNAEDSGSFTSIHESLWLALQQLRHETEERILWIDAICINQRNNDERNYQVLLMQKLFARAESVLVWLGEESHDSRAAFGLVSRIAAAAAADRGLSTQDMKNFLTAQDLGGLGLPDHADTAWFALDSLFWRPWFSRVWVIQEITVARRASILCGPSRCSWDDLVETARYTRLDIQGH